MCSQSGRSPVKLNCEGIKVNGILSQIERFSGQNGWSFDLMATVLLAIVEVRFQFFILFNLFRGRPL